LAKLSRIDIGKIAYSQDKVARRPAEAIAISSRLDAAYRDRFDAIGGGFSAWVNATHIGVEALFGGRVGPSGALPSDSGACHLPFGRVAMIMTIEEAERRIRADIENYLAWCAGRW
jgi:hypothetical protein